MSITVVAWNEEAEALVEYDNRLRVASLEATVMAEECASGSSTVVLDDSTADWYIYPYRPIYFLETAALGDEFMGIIGPFWTEGRRWRRGDERTGSRRVVELTLRDINSLLSLRIQKGSDAERDAETDVERVTWLINTPEVIGGYGSHGYSIAETSFFFTDAPVDMSESDYTFQYSEGVLNDCMQQSQSNAYLYPAPNDYDPLRIGIWYGRTERSDFASLHKISNDMADISPEYWTNFDGVTPQYDTGYVFPPSLDAVLERDPSRTITGAGLQWDGSNTYAQLPVIVDTLTRRDMVFAGELVKNSTQALERLERCLDANQYEDDAIECAIRVPDWLVHAFVAGHRVQFKSTYMPGYQDDYVWMRVSKVTYRQVFGEDGTATGQYDLALDLRAESPPGPPPPPPPEPFVCVGGSFDATAAGIYPRLGSVNGNSAMVHYYYRPGWAVPDEPTFPYTGSWHFPVFSGSGDFNVSDLNTWRMIFIGPGTVTVHTVTNNTATYAWVTSKQVTPGVFNTIDSGTGTTGVDLDIHIPESDGIDCITYLDINSFPATGVGGIGANGCTWTPD